MDVLTIDRDKIAKNRLVQIANGKFTTLKRVHSIPKNKLESVEIVNYGKVVPQCVHSIPKNKLESVEIVNYGKLVPQCVHSIPKLIWKRYKLGTLESNIENVFI
jgi:hypothetical protein